MAKEKYRVISPFTYKGKDGTKKQGKWRRIGPGEPVPPLSSNEREKLLIEQKICEVDSYGENIKFKKLVDLDQHQIEGLMNQSRGKMMYALKKTSFSNDTLEKLRIYAEKEKMPKDVIAVLDKKLGNI